MVPCPASWLYWDTVLSYCFSSRKLPLSSWPSAARWACPHQAATPLQAPWASGDADTGAKSHGGPERTAQPGAGVRRQPLSILWATQPLPESPDKLPEPLLDPMAADACWIQIYVPITNVEAEVERFYKESQDLLELTPKKCVLFITGDWNAKLGSQEIPGVTGKFCLGVQNEAGQRLTKFCQENKLVIANTLFQQHKRWPYTWTSPDGQHQNQIDSILCSQRWRSCIQSAKTRPGDDCGSDNELLTAKFRLILKKVGKTMRPLRYDLNLILYVIQ